MATKEQGVQGQALYLELRSPDATLQAVMLPDAFDSDGELVWSKMFRRVDRGDGTNLKWTMYSVAPTAARKEELRQHMESYYSEDYMAWEAQVAERMRNLMDYFGSVVASGYTLVNDKPLYIDITHEDVDASKKGELSAALWKRVKAVRTQAKFPENARG